MLFLDQEQSKLSPLEKILAEVKRASVPDPVTDTGTDDSGASSSGQSSEESEGEEEVNIKLNLGRPAKPEECMSDDEVR